MPKRIANSRFNRMRPGRIFNRFGRIRYGWRALKALTDLEKVERRLEEQDLDEKLRVKYENFKQVATRILPRKLLQRSQNR